MQEQVPASPRSGDKLSRLLKVSIPGLAPSGRAGESPAAAKCNSDGNYPKVPRLDLSKLSGAVSSASSPANKPPVQHTGTQPDSFHEGVSSPRLNGLSGSQSCRPVRAIPSSHRANGASTYTQQHQVHQQGAGIQAFLSPRGVSSPRSALAGSPRLHWHRQRPQSCKPHSPASPRTQVTGEYMNAQAAAKASGLHAAGRASPRGTTSGTGSLPCTALGTGMPQHAQAQYSTHTFHASTDDAATMQPVPTSSRHCAGQGTLTCGNNLSPRLPMQQRITAQVANVAARKAAVANLLLSGSSSSSANGASVLSYTSASPRTPHSAKGVYADPLLTGRPPSCGHLTAASSATFGLQACAASAKVHVLCEAPEPTCTSSTVHFMSHARRWRDSYAGGDCSDEVKPGTPSMYASYQEFVTSKGITRQSASRPVTVGPAIRDPHSPHSDAVGTHGPAEPTVPQPGMPAAVPVLQRWLQDRSMAPCMGDVSFHTCLYESLVEEGPRRSPHRHSPHRSNSSSGSMAATGEVAAVPLKAALSDIGKPTCGNSSRHNPVKLGDHPSSVRRQTDSPTLPSGRGMAGQEAVRHIVLTVQPGMRVSGLITHAHLHDDGREQVQQPTQHNSDYADPYAHFSLNAAPHPARKRAERLASDSSEHSAAAGTAVTYANAPPSVVAQQPQQQQQQQPSPRRAALPGSPSIRLGASPSSEQQGIIPMGSPCAQLPLPGVLPSGASNLSHVGIHPPAGGAAVSACGASSVLGTGTGMLGDAAGADAANGGSSGSDPEWLPAEVVSELAHSTSEVQLPVGASAGQAAAAAVPAVQPGVAPTNKILQLGISIAVLQDLAKRLPATSSTAEAWEQYLKPPTTAANHCRFLDLILAKEPFMLGNGVIMTPDRFWLNLPQYYVIHAWEGNFQALVAALADYFSTGTRPLTHCYVWLDVLALNHHPGKRDPKELIRYHEIAPRCTKALLVLDACASVLCRLWCMYEVHVFTHACIGASKDKLAVLNAGVDWHVLADMFFCIDLWKAIPSVHSDRTRLLSDIVRSMQRGPATEANTQQQNQQQQSQVDLALWRESIATLSGTLRTTLVQCALAEAGEAAQRASSGISHSSSGGSGNGRARQATGGALVLHNHAHATAAEAAALALVVVGRHIEAEDRLMAALQGMPGVPHIVGAPQPPLLQTAAGPLPADCSWESAKGAEPQSPRPNSERLGGGGSQAVSSRDVSPSRMRSAAGGLADGGAGSDAQMSQQQQQQARVRFARRSSEGGAMGEVDAAPFLAEGEAMSDDDNPGDDGTTVHFKAQPARSVAATGSAADDDGSLHSAFEQSLGVLAARVAADKDYNVRGARSGGCGSGGGSAGSDSPRSPYLSRSGSSKHLMQAMGQLDRAVVTPDTPPGSGPPSPRLRQHHAPSTMHHAPSSRLGADTLSTTSASSTMPRELSIRGSSSLGLGSPSRRTSQGGTQGASSTGTTSGLGSPRSSTRSGGTAAEEEASSAASGLARMQPPGSAGTGTGGRGASSHPQLLRSHSSLRARSAGVLPSERSASGLSRSTSRINLTGTLAGPAWRARPSAAVALVTLMHEHQRFSAVSIAVPAVLASIPNIRWVEPAAAAAAAGAPSGQSQAQSARSGTDGKGGTSTSADGTALSVSMLLMRPSEAWAHRPHWHAEKPASIPHTTTTALLALSELLPQLSPPQNEGAAQLAGIAAASRAARLGRNHPATLRARAAFAVAFGRCGRTREALALAQTCCIEAAGQAGDLSTLSGHCLCAVARICMQQNNHEMAYQWATKAASILRGVLGAHHPASLDALQLSGDALAGAQEWARAVAVLQQVVEGRASPGGLRHSLASPTALAPLNQLLHLRVVAYLEEKAALEESAGGAAARMALPTLLRRMAALERQLKQALHAAPRSIELKADLVAVLNALNKKTDAAMVEAGKMHFGPGAPK